MKCSKASKLYIFGEGLIKQAFKKRIEQNWSINNKVITKKNFDDHKIVVFSINIFAFIMFMGKIKRK